MVPGEVLVGAEPVPLNADRPAIVLLVTNTGDRPVQVGSHYHFAQANPALDFDRGAAQGHRLNIPAGTAVRFEPGIAREVSLVPLAGRRLVPGLRPRGVPGDVSLGVPGDVSGGVPGDVSGGVSGGVPGDVLGGVSGGLARGVSGDVSDGVPGGVPGEVPRGVPRDASGDARDSSPGSADNHSGGGDRG